MTVPVSHDLNARRFEATIDGSSAFLEYEERSGSLVFTHTYVPEALRGRGLAAVLTETALAYARSHGRRVVPVCSYVSAYLEKHREYADLLGDPA